MDRKGSFWLQQCIEAEEARAGFQSDSKNKQKISLQENYQCMLTKFDMVWKLGSDAKQLQTQTCQNEKVEAGDFDFL